MPKVVCSWDVCRHFDHETGCCDGPDVIELENAEIENDDDELEQYLVCMNYEEA